MIHLVTFHDENMTRAAELCESTAMNHGVNQTKVWSKAEFEQLSVCRENERVFQQPKDVRRAWGWWAWKPAIILEALNSEPVQADDIVIYADAGIEFINNVRYITDRMHHDVFLFGNNFEHAHWCKRDVIDTIQPYEEWDRYGKQAQASVVFVRKSILSFRFVGEWLDWCLYDKGRLVDDSPSVASNHPEFQEHRHDQAILTTMAHRRHVRLHYWPAIYNDGAFVYEKQKQYETDTYPAIFHHHRKRNHEFNKAA